MPWIMIFLDICSSYWRKEITFLIPAMCLAVNTSFSRRRDVMVLPLSETIDCIHGKLTEKKILQPRRSNRLSRSCCSSFNLSSCSTSSEFSCNSKTPCLLLTNEVNCNLLRESKHQEGRVRKSVNSICVTVSAITHLSDDDSLKDRCLSCSLDGLKVRHPRCDTRVNGIIKTRPPCDTIIDTSLHFEKSQQISNVSTTFSSMTLHSTWPSRWQNSGGEKFLRASTGADIDLTTISSSDSLEIVSCDPHSGEDEEQERTNIAAGNIAVDIIQKDKNCFLVPIEQLNQVEDVLKKNPSEEDILKNVFHRNNTLKNDPYGDDICEDWDDGHESDENGSSTYTCDGTVRQDKESRDDSVIYVSEVDVDVYSVRSKSTEIHKNEVMSLCDWSFLVESKRKKKKERKLLKKTKSALISEKKSNDDVSSCSQSHDEIEEEDDDDDSEEEEEEDDDHGSVNRYFMNQMKKKKKVHGKKVR
jgi:hypothetical protein